MANYDPLYYLKEKDPLIRNQLVPVPVEQDNFLELFMKYFRAQFEKQSKFQNNQKLEIEVKLGTFIAKEQGFYQMLQNFKHISKIHHILVSDYAQFYTFQPNFLLPPWNEFYFDCTSLTPSFQNLLSYFRKLRKNRKDNQTIWNCIENLYIGQYDSTLSELVENLRLDLLLQNNQRVSIYYDGRREILIKERGDSLDIMKDVKQFRFSSNIENYLNIPDEFDSFVTGAQFRTVRFKSQMNFKYQFIDISISRVLQFENANEIYSYFNKHQKNNIIDWKGVLLELVLRLFDLNKSNVQSRESIIQNPRKNEIEFEICDLQFFRENLVPAFKRLLRNVDSFFYVDKVQYDILHEQISKIHPGINRNAYSPPLIGQYLQKTYNHAYKCL